LGWWLQQRAARRRLPDVPDIFAPLGIHVEVQYSRDGDIRVWTTSHDGSVPRTQVLGSQILPLPAGDVVFGFTAGTGGASATQEVGNFLASRIVGDGLPDLYEETNGLDTSVDDSRDDPDRDGIVNWFEWFFGTDPQTPEGTPLALNTSGAGTVILNYPTAPGVNPEAVAFEWSVDLLDWHLGTSNRVIVDLQPDGTATYATTVSGFAPDAPKIFVRMRRAL
jgi:hypothetical protein